MKMLVTIIIGTLVLCSSLPATSQSKGVVVGSDNSNFAANRYAFVVGNDHYLDPSISELTSCRLDAERIASYLKSSSGFSIPQKNLSLLLDADKMAFETNLLALLDQVRQPTISTLYFYYSGHGLPGNIVPTDFKQDDPKDLISYDWIISELKKRNIAAKIFIIDACYAGSFIATKNIPTYNQAVSKIFSSSSGSNTVAFTATSAYRVTPAGKHESLFTKYFLDGLSNQKTDLNGDVLISAGELNQMLQNSLGRSNAPQFYGNKDFPIGRLGRHTIEESSAITSVPLELDRNQYNAVVHWRHSIDKQKENPNELQATIEALLGSTSVEAKAKLGYLYRKGIGVTKDPQKALTYLIPASLEQNAFAHYNLGVMYSKGIAVDTNEKKAFHYYLLSAKNGNAFAQHNLGSYYYKRSVKTLDEAFKMAIYWYLKAAQIGLPESQTALGILYSQLSKHSRKKNKKMQYKKIALWCYEKAATQGFGYGQYLLAKHYTKSAPLKEEKATYWLKKACGNNYLRACSALLNTHQ